MMHGHAVSYRASLIIALVAATAVLSSQSLSADSFDWRNVNGYNWNTLAKSQFGGTCWDFGPTGALEAKYMLTRNDTSFAPDLSEQQNCWETSPDMGSTAGGGGFDLILNYFATHGDVSESDCPVETNTAYQDTPSPSDPWPLSKIYSAPDSWTNHVWKSSGWQSVTAANLKAMIKSNGPLVIGFNADDLYSSVADLKANYVVHPAGDNHSVSLEGFCDDATCPTGGYWIIKNSWGSTGGDGTGFYYVPYNSSLDAGLGHLYAITGAVYYSGTMTAVTWGGGTGTWASGGSNWSGVDQYGNSLPTYAWENKETSATFNTVGGSMSLSGTVIAHGVTIAAGATGYVFNGVNNGALTVTGGGITAHESVAFNVPVTIGAPQTWTIDSGKSLTVGGIHTIISNLTINAAGNVYVNGVIDGGGVLNAGGATPGSITFSGAGSFNASGDGTVPVNLVNSSTGGLYLGTAAGLTRTWTGVISGSGTGTVHKTDQGTLIFAGTNTYSASTSIDGGVLQADSGVGLPSGSFLDPQRRRAATEQQQRRHVQPRFGHLGVEQVRVEQQR